MSDTSAPGIVPAGPTPAPAPAAAPAPVAPIAKPWYDGKLDAEHVGVLQQKLWHEKPVEDVATEALKSYRALEKKFGVPADQLLRFNQDDPAAMQAVYDKLGVPKTAAEYDFADAKFKDGSGVDEDVAAKFREVGTKYHVPKEAMQGMVREFVSILDEAENTENTVAAGHLETARATLRQSWGGNLQANMFVAQQGAKALGLDANIINALESVAGYVPTMQALLHLGQKLGEDKYVQGSPGINGGTMTVEQAVAEKSRLMADGTFRSRASNPGSAEWQQLTGLNRMIAGAM